MALSGETLPLTNTTAAYKQVHGARVFPLTFASGTGTLAPLTPVGKITASGFMVEWDPTASDGSQTIYGFTDHRYSHDLISDKETIHTVIKAGTMRYSDVVLPSGVAEATLIAALRAERMRSLDFYFDGLGEVV